MIVTRTVNLTDALARANVVDAFRGAGAPVGVTEVVEDGPAIVVRFDDAITAPELIDDLIAIESLFVAAHGQDEMTLEAAAARASAGLGDPELDAGRILETYLRGRP